MTEPDQRDVDVPSTEVVLSDHYRPKASFPLRVLITLMVIGMTGLGAAGYLLFETQRSLSISSAENADRLTALASLEAKQSELVALVESHTRKLATQGDALVQSLELTVYEGLTVVAVSERIANVASNFGFPKVVVSKAMNSEAVRLALESEN